MTKINPKGINKHVYDSTYKTPETRHLDEMGSETNDTKERRESEVMSTTCSRI